MNGPKELAMEIQAFDLPNQVLAQVQRSQDDR